MLKMNPDRLNELFGLFNDWNSIHVHNLDPRGKRFFVDPSRMKILPKCRFSDNDSDEVRVPTVKNEVFVIFELWKSFEEPESYWDEKVERLEVFGDYLSERMGLEVSMIDDNDDYQNDFDDD